MRNVEKIDIEENKNKKRTRRRRRNFLGYYFIVIFLVITIGVSLSVTLLFNVKEIIVTGSTLYENVDIIKATGIVTGDNLVRLNTEDAEKNILEKMLYIDDVDIKKGFPDKLYINLTPSVAKAYIQCKGGYMLISKGWRILELTETPEDPALLVINGFDPVSTDKAMKAASIDAGKDAIINQIMTQIDNQGLEKIVSIDISNKFRIKINYDNRINIIIQNSSDLEYKLRYAYQLLTQTPQLGDNKKGYLVYHDSLGYSFISEEEYNEINSKIDSETASSETMPADQTTLPGTIDTTASGNNGSISQTSQAVQQSTADQ